MFERSSMGSSTSYYSLVNWHQLLERNDGRDDTASDRQLRRNLE